MIIKTNCQECGKKKAIKNKVVFGYNGCGVLIKTLNACHKCGWKPEGENEHPHHGGEGTPWAPAGC